MPESGLPIRVYEEHDMWHVDYGEGETEDNTSREKAEAAADAVAQAEERTVVVGITTSSPHAHQLGQIRPRGSRWLLRPPGRDLCRTTAKERQQRTPTRVQRSTAFWLEGDAASWETSRDDLAVDARIAHFADIATLVVHIADVDLRAPVRQSHRVTFN